MGLLSLLRRYVVLLAACTMAIPAAAATDLPDVPPGLMTSLPSRPVLNPVMDCAALPRATFDQTPDAPAAIASAELETKSNGVEFCHVKGMIAPQVQFELHLPTKSWQGRYLAGGCGGTCGVLLDKVTPNCDNLHAFGGSFALSFNNSGHVGTSGIDTMWAANSPQSRIDFAYRASHVTAQVTKAIIKAYYGRAPDYSYFQGCSNGGREAMMEVERYPGDFDGVIAGAPSLWVSSRLVRIMWETRIGTDTDGKQILTEESVKLLHDAVINACDGIDGLKDGQIDDGRACHYDPQALVCKKGQQASCITQQQADVMRAYYRGPTDDQGRHLYIGGNPYGSELLWAGKGSFSMLGAKLAAEQTRYMIYGGKPPLDPDWHAWKLDQEMLARLTRDGGYYQPNNPDLAGFKAAGGKLIIWQGAADPSAGPNTLLDFYQHVRDKFGGYTGTDPFMKMFLLPGVYHCGGGYLPYEIDLLAPLVRWVERGEAPDALPTVAKLPDGKLRSRPVYAYPAKAQYKGSGSIDDAENFRRVMPKTMPDDHYHWLGEGMTGGEPPALP